MMNIHLGSEVHGIVNALLLSALGSGLHVSVFDGEEYTVKESTSYGEITENMAGTDNDTLTFAHPETGRVGAVWLIYENGYDLIADYTDSVPMGLLLAPAMQLAEQYRRHHE